jgi:hypothetical protein
VTSTYGKRIIIAAGEDTKAALAVKQARQAPLTMP